MKFSVIIPTYNRQKFIAKAIYSILAQNYANYEVLVVDDGSTDNTEERVKSINDNRIKYFKKENNERGAARNFGIEMASGDYVTFLDSDDFLLENYLKTAFIELNTLKRPPFYHQGYQVVDVKGRVLSKINFIRNNDFGLLAEGNPFSCMGVFIRRDVLDKFRFNEDRRLSGSEDWELWLRISANYGFVTCNKITACLVNHDYRSVKNYKEEDLILRKELSIKYAFTDEKVKQVYGKYLTKMNVSGDTYIALHLLLAGKKSGAIRHLKTLKDCPSLIFRKRTLAIIKHLLF